MQLSNVHLLYKSWLTILLFMNENLEQTLQANIHI